MFRALVADRIVGAGCHYRDPKEFAFDGANIWVANNAGNSVSKL